MRASPASCSEPVVALSTPSHDEMMGEAFGCRFRPARLLLFAPDLHLRPQGRVASGLLCSQPVDERAQFLGDPVLAHRELVAPALVLDRQVELKAVGAPA